MPRIHFEFTKPQEAGVDAPATGLLRLRLINRQPITGKIRTTEPFPVYLVAGIANVELSVTPAGYGWEVVQYIDGEEPVTEVVIVEAGSVNFSELTRVSARSLKPSAGNVDAWVAALNSLRRGLRSGVAAINSSGHVIDADGNILLDKASADAAYVQPAALATKLDKAEASNLYVTPATLSASTLALVSLARSKAAYAGNRIAAVGDSIVWGYPGGKNAWIDYAGIFSNGRLQRIRNAGVSADHSSHVLARLDADVINKGGIDSCIVAVGINDRLANIAPETTRANMTAIYEKLEAAGIRPILWTLLANTNATAAQKTAIIEHNAWVRAYAAAHFYDCIDLYDMSRDPATGGMLPEWTADGTHPGYAYHLIGKAVAAFLSPKFPPPPILLAQASTERRSLIDNALMLTDTNADGIPDTWGASFGAGYTHSIATPAPGTDVLGSWAVVTMAAGGTGRRLEWSTAVTRLPLGLAFANPGDRIAYAVRVSLAPGADQAGVSIFGTAEGANLHAAAAALSYAADGLAYGEFTVPAGFTGRIGIAMSIGNGSGVFKLAQPVMLNLSRLGRAA